MAITDQQLLEEIARPAPRAWNFEIGDVVEFHHRFWAPGEPDRREEVERVERRLNQPLPAMLRAFYLGTWLRESAELHLSFLDDLRIEDGTLVFGREHQGAWHYGIRVCDLEAADPPVVADVTLNQWKLDGITLSQWLALFTLLNRLHEPPCAAATFAGGTWWHTWSASLGVGHFQVLEGAICDDGFAGARDSVLLAKALGVLESH